MENTDTKTAHSSPYPRWLASGVLALALLGLVAWYYWPVQYSALITDLTIPAKLHNELLPAEYLVVVKTFSYNSTSNPVSGTVYKREIKFIAGRKDNTGGDSADILKRLREWLNRYVHVRESEGHSSNGQINEVIAYDTPQTIGEFKCRMTPIEPHAPAQQPKAWDIELVWTEQKR
jgi:hypothetical protein